jgi:hypothetical protein
LADIRGTSNGVELLYVSQQLGHHSASFTLTQYAHLLPRDRRGEVNRLDAPASARKPGASDSSNTVLAETETARNSLESQAV